MTTPDLAPVTGGAAPAATADPDASDAGAGLPEADEADAHRPGDSTGVPLPAQVVRASALRKAAA